METPIELVFLENAPFAEGVPANFKNVIPACQVSPMVKYFEQSGVRPKFRHRRIDALGDRAGYLPIGLFGSPQNWMARERQPHSFSNRAPELRSALAEHPRLKVLIDYSWEAGQDQTFLDAFDEFVADIQIDPRRVVLLISDRALEGRYHEHLNRKHRSLTNSWQVIGADFFLIYSGVEFRQRLAFGRPDTTISAAEVEFNCGTLRPYKFLSLNRRPRWHRFMLAMALTQLKLQQQGICSMSSPAYEGDWHSEHNMLEGFGRLMDQAVWQKLKAVEASTLATLPWTIDVNMDKSGHTSGYAFQNFNRELFLRSYVQIVTESYMEGANDSLFITEKICKALANLQPFLCFGMARSNARLAELGFAPVSVVHGAYDDELAVGRRLTRLYHALDQLAGMSMEAVHEVYHQALPRTIHNQQRLFEMPEFLGAQIVSRLRSLLPN